MRFSQKENRRLGEQIEAALGRCLLDMRVRPGGSHHQKFVVLRHPGRPGLDVAFVGGIDLCHRRRDDVAHAGDPQALPIAAVYGDRPPGPDAHVAIRGPAVGDAGAVFRERWQDPSPLSRNPVRRLRALPGHEGTQACVLPAPLPFPGACGPHAVQLLPTHPDRRRGYGFTPHGERSIARSYIKVLRRARDLIGLEDQYLWSRQVAKPFADALAANPGLRMTVILPHWADQGVDFAACLMKVSPHEGHRLTQDSGEDPAEQPGCYQHEHEPVPCPGPAEDRSHQKAKYRDQVQESVNPVDGEGHRPPPFMKNAL
jgi:phosphatidylserine/phosphatidylglycerophosphate/cardiolipin synthase-like enzyme